MKNKFIVWDKNKKEFFADHSFLLSCDGSMNEFSSENASADFYTESFNYIGKKDINDKPIYADSSIVEFVWDMGESRDKTKGYFKYSTDTLSYLLFIIYDNGVTKLDSPETIIPYNIFYNNLSDFKIIDTIQERNLRLIK